MAVRTLALVGCALLVCVLVGGGGYPQAPPDPIPAPGLPGIPAPQAGVVSSGPVASIPQAPAPRTVDQLIDTLSELRRQKAELEKKEQAVTAELREKLKEQRERLSKLGIEPAPVPPPAAVGGVFLSDIPGVVTAPVSPPGPTR